MTLHWFARVFSGTLQIGDELLVLLVYELLVYEALS